MNKTFIVVLLYFLCSYACAQTSSNDVVRKYNAFKKALPASRFHFVLNQDKYAAGDTIYFKAYFLKDDNQRVPGRQIVNLNLVGEGGSIVSQFLFQTENGVGSNQVVLPETLRPGVYLLTAYSSWMKNFEKPPVFTKEIFVVGEKRIAVNTPKNIQSAKVTLTNNIANVAIPGQSLLRYQRMNLIVTNKGQVTFVKSFLQGVDRNVSISLSGDALRPGTNVINVVDQQWLTIGTETIYVPEEHQVTAKIESEQLLSTRKNASLTITVFDDNKQPVQGEFSVSVVNPAAADTSKVSFAQQLSNSAPKVESWRQIMSGRTAQRYNYKTDLVKMGRAFFADGTPVKEGTRFVFYFQDNDITTQTFTTEGNRVKLNVPDIKGNDELFYLAEYMGDELSGVTLQWESVTINPPSPPTSMEMSEGDLYGVFAANKKMIDKAFSFNQTSSAAINEKIERNTSDLESKIVSGPDITVRIDDYVLFTTMAEMIKEIVPALNLRKVRGVSVASVGLQEGIAPSEPLYIIDGVVTKDTHYFLSLKPADLVAIKLVTNPKKLVPLGAMGKSGLVIVESKTGKLKPLYDPSKEVNGINKQIPFKQTVNTNIRRPDFKSTIYWNPVVKTDGNGKAVVEFQCSDDLGPVKVRVNGMTSDGRPFSGETTLTQVLSENK